MICYFCGRELEGKGVRVIEPVPGSPGLLRIRCRRSCAGVPFVLSEEEDK